MPSDRLTVSLDDDSRAALEDLSDRTDASQSELVRQALTFYANNFEAADMEGSNALEAYHRMLSQGEHVLLDIDFLHCFLRQAMANGDFDPEFRDAIDQIAAYHAEEYSERFDSLEELLEWLALCGFLTVRQSDSGAYHVVFPSENIRWFMSRFIQKCATDLSFDVEVETGVAKTRFVEIRNE